MEILLCHGFSIMFGMSLYKVTEPIFVLQVMGSHDDQGQHLTAADQYKAARMDAKARRGTLTVITTINEGVNLCIAPGPASE